MKTHLAPIGPGLPHDLLQSFSQALDECAPDTLVLGGFAYATLGGVDQFISDAGASRSWISMPKRFILGIHHGITEPSALEMLRGIDNSEVRVFIPGTRLTPDSLVAKPLFHPKLLALTDANVREVRFLQAGSANLTSSAIGSVPKNYEFSIALSAERERSVDTVGKFATWWSDIWGRSRLVDRPLLARYAQVRLRVLERNPILRRASEPPSNIRTAEYFFIEVGAASGPPGLRHQVEFPEGLAAFFGEPVRRRRDFTLTSDGVSWDARPLSYKVTTFGVEIWRLGMPTQNNGGEPIAHRAIRFKRTDDPEIFDFEVADTNSSEVTAWENAANVLGHLGATQGQNSRKYGFY